MSYGKHRVITMALRYTSLHRYFITNLFQVRRYSHHVFKHRETRLIYKPSIAMSPLSHIPHSNAFHTTFSLHMPKIVPYLLSDIGEGIVEVVVKEWLVKKGDKVSQFDPVCEVQSDKASVTITSRFDGVVDKLHYDIDAVAKVGQPLLDIQVAEETQDIEVAAEVKVEKNLRTSEPDTVEDKYMKDKALATPAVRRIAKENKVDLSKVSATGKQGRVLKEDILRYLETPEPITPLPVSTQSVGEDTVQEFAGVRKAMFKSMTEAWKIPHLGYSDEVDLTDLLIFRSEARLEQKAGVKVTYLPYLIKAVSLALHKYPELNAHMDDTGPRLLVRGDHNIGVAMDTSQGLIVPVVKNVQQRSIIQIAHELSRLQLLGSQNKLGIEDLSGGTITLSNIGAIGGTQASPVLLPPQIVIGAITKILRQPRYDKNGVLVPRDIVTISWSADHRATDGATVAKFSNLFKLYLASPQLLLQL